MKGLAAGTAALGIWLAAGSAPTVLGTPGSGRALAPAASASALTPGAATEAIQRYCVRCHSDERLTGNLSLEGFDAERAHEAAEIGEKMIVKLRAGMMPPPGGRRPPADSLLALVETLESVIDRTAAVEREPGARRFQRLNRAEYQRVVRDLLDLDVDAGRWLPADTYLGNFDNLSAAQGLSATLLEAYLRAATEVSRLAIGNAAGPATTTSYTLSVEVSQHAWDHIEGAPFGTRGGTVVLHDFPADGTYVFEVETQFGAGAPETDVDISIDGRGGAQLALEHGGRATVPVRTDPIFVAAGQRRVAAAFIRTVDGPYEDRLRPPRWSFTGGEDSRAWANYGITVLPHLRELRITGPVAVAGVSETPSRRRVFTCYPSAPTEARPCAESILTRLATRAYRRPVTPEDLAGPMSFYDDGAASGDFELGVRTGLQAILASPSFIFRLERPPAGAAPGETYRLADVDLASRLSFFLWGTVPDDELLELAAAGRLSDRRLLEQQVERLLADPRSEVLATRFASQWLRLQDTDKNSPDTYLYPDFTAQLRSDMVRETQLLFDHLVRNDRSLFELITADYTFVNERLARHYGIPGVAGAEFRRVAYTDATRRGVLGHGSVLLLTSMANRTSPVLRGKWALEVLMGAPPPPPPPDVPAFETTESVVVGRALTTRERMEAHRSNPTCNACHRLMDPIGLALDNFDVTGQWRTRENGMPLDTRGTFYDDTPLGSPDELTEVLLSRPLPIARSFAANMLAFAVGRRVEYYDQPTIRSIAREAEANDYRLSSFITAVVSSDPFQMARLPIPATTSAAPGA
ncbi:MAG TPA: DUF1592 domain-containing protein [Longimicrobiales bacterium]|nr:DUF1592 domain-containing protein [Longimicrobiales bacterium]